MKALTLMIRMTHSNLMVIVFDKSLSTYKHKFVDITDNQHSL